MVEGQDWWYAFDGVVQFIALHQPQFFNNFEPMKTLKPEILLKKLAVSDLSEYSMLKFFPQRELRAKHKRKYMYLILYFASYACSFCSCGPLGWRW